MNFNEYQELASRTANNGLSVSEKICNWAMGLAGEAGELIELSKKEIFHKVVPSKDKVIKELGDVLWYLSNYALTYDIKLEEVAEKNIQKLKDRYPQGFQSGGGIR